MKEITATVKLQKLPVSGLSTVEQSLVRELEEALAMSYSPYSNFAVGSCALLENGIVIKGANQENAAYPSGLCAERVALFYANAHHPNEKVESLAVTFQSKNGMTPFPCGGCLQVISEIEQKQQHPIRIIMQSSETEVHVAEGVSNLMPFAFQKEHLG